MQTKNQYFQLKCSSFVICRNNQGKFLSVKETKNRGWWFPGGKVDPPENFFQAAIREVREEAGIDIELKGILRTEYRIKDDFQKIRVIFYAEPKDEDQKPKSKADKDSLEARWLTVEEIEALKDGTPGWRGSELYEWSKYVKEGGQIYPLSWLNPEGSPVGAEVDPMEFEAIKKEPKVKKEKLNNPVQEVKDTNKPPTENTEAKKSQVKKRSWCPVQ